MSTEVAAEPANEELSALIDAKFTAFREGSIVGCFDRDQANPEVIMRYALAGDHDG